MFIKEYYCFDVMIQSILGLFYEDFVIGDEIKHALSKTIFESDNNLFFLQNEDIVTYNLDDEKITPVITDSKYLCDAGINGIKIIELILFLSQFLNLHLKTY